jgi:hypothetical protein
VIVTVVNVSWAAVPARCKPGPGCIIVITGIGGAIIRAAVIRTRSRAKAERTHTDANAARTGIHANLRHRRNCGRRYQRACRDNTKNEFSHYSSPLRDW